MQNKKHLLNFVTDLRRAVYCLVDKDEKTYKVFLNHADKIFQEKIKDQQFSKTWSNLLKVPITKDNKQRKQIADKLLTLSSMIFLKI